MRLRAAASASLSSARPRRLLEDALCENESVLMILFHVIDSCRAVLLPTVADLIYESESVCARNASGSKWLFQMHQQEARGGHGALQA
jgi:hypothetical protein